ncbi:MAG: glycoside hydrolase [Bacteroidales bacterium]|nr:glycoside hydrolase [Bacteroidales bacterium]
MNKAFLFLCFLLTLIGSALMAQFGLFNKTDFKALNYTHDIICLPAWGPYSKKYAGISHIPDIRSGMRYDVTIVPGYYRNRVMVPNVLFESGYYPWEISADMHMITYRYELEWKDRVYVDATYSILDSSSVLISMKCVNNTLLPQALQLNLLAFINYPDAYPLIKADFKKNVKWINALQYDKLEFAVPRPSDNLVYDGWLKGEERKPDCLDGRALGKEFGANEGDFISYTLNTADKATKGSLAIRYRLEPGEENALQITGLINEDVSLHGTGKYEMLVLPYSMDNPGYVALSFRSLGGAAVELNGFFTGPAEEIDAVKIIGYKQKIYPQIIPVYDIPGVVSAYPDIPLGLILKYPDVNTFYGIAWDFSPLIIREVLDRELDIIFRKYVHEHNYKVFFGDSLGHYTNVFMRPIELKAESEQIHYALLSSGSLHEVENTIKAFHQRKQHYISPEAKSMNPYASILSQGEKYVFSQKMMQAAILSNIVYPIYTQNQYIRHFTPGKWWNSLYTWDSGFEALGLTEIDIKKAIQCLNAYTTPVGSQSAFIHHGSPVPVQHYAFLELWNKTQSHELLAYFYPRLKQYYEFLAGKSGSSTTATFRSSLLKTWDYFYNSGGWDDYPPQKAVRDSGLKKSVSPVITTAHCIRVAKILRKTAEVLDQKNDLQIYDKDIAMFEKALQKYAWDPASGYFSYVIHDSLNNPAGFFRHPESGQNYNMGLDGAYPLLSGICSEEQKKVLIQKIFSPEHMWTQAGICVVDKAAAYYRTDGYWNGAVWMPHQWFIWKTMLDLGETDYAFRIADTALELWKKETDETYFTYEHFIADIARGAGWHQFGALSAPVLNWFAAYYKPGTVNAGFEVWINNQTFNNDHSAYEASLSFDKTTKAHKRSMIVCLNPMNKYRVLINNKEADFTERMNGLLEIVLPASNSDCNIMVEGL